MRAQDDGNRVVGEAIVVAAPLKARRSFILDAAQLVPGSLFLEFLPRGRDRDASVSRRERRRRARSAVLISVAHEAPMVLLVVVVIIALLAAVFSLTGLAARFGVSAFWLRGDSCPLLRLVGS